MSLPADWTKAMIIMILKPGKPTLLPQSSQKFLKE
jgi:hypothetical protein